MPSQVVFCGCISLMSLGRKDWRRDRHLGRLRGKAGHDQTKMVHSVWSVSEAATLKELLEQRG